MTPSKPTRDGATGARELDELAERGLDADRTAEAAAAAGGAPGRERIGGGEENRRHPPHVTANDREAPLQEEHESPDDVPALPANASGSEEQSTESAPRIRPESMYDGRPDEDKDQPPSERIE